MWMPHSGDGHDLRDGLWDEYVEWLGEMDESRSMESVSEWLTRKGSPASSAERDARIAIVEYAKGG